MRASRSVAALCGWMIAAAQGTSGATEISVVRVEVEGVQASGLSGLDGDGAGGLLAVSERGHALLRLVVDGSRLVQDGGPIRLGGVSAGLELESLAWLGDGRVAIGTETQREYREQDEILLVRLEEGHGAVTGSLALRYEPWGLKAGKNHGIEGLCAAEGWLLAGSEAVGEMDGRRYAPLAVHDLEGGGWTHHYLGLSSGVGRLASLACRAAGGGALEVLAIERQFEISRLLRFELQPDAAAGSRIDPEILMDLAVHGRARWEGVAWLPDGRLVVLADNDRGGVVGPAEALLVNLGRRERLAP
jgi:hypothetical protein